MDFTNLEPLPVKARLHKVDATINNVIKMLEQLKENGSFKATPIESHYFNLVFGLLVTYILYTKSDRNDEARLKAIFNICKIQSVQPDFCHDYILLALNWFHRRLKTQEAVEASVSEMRSLQLIPALSHINYKMVGKL